MNRLLSLIFCMTLFAATKGQKNYAEAMQRGRAAFEKEDYREAINKYFAAEAFEPNKKDSVKIELKRAFDAIDNQRIKALADRALAEKNEKEANKQKLLTDEALTEAKKQTVKAQKEQQKLQKLYEFIKYNNGQVFAAIKRNDSLLLLLKIKEYNLTTKYDPVIDDAYKFNSFYELSDYYLRNKNYSAALSWADSMCRQYPGMALSFEQRSIVNYYRADWEQALADVDSSLQLNPDSSGLALLEWNKALILSNLNRYEESHNCITNAVELLEARWYTEDWSDYVMPGDMDSSMNMKTIYMELKEQKDAMTIYATIIDIYAGSAPVSNLEKMAGENFATSVLLSIINYINTHMHTQPADYIGYLVNGFFWELVNEPELSKKNYGTFLKKHQQSPNKKYNRYKNGFNSPVYNKLKK